MYLDYLLFNYYSNYFYFVYHLLSIIESIILWWTLLSYAYANCLLTVFCQFRVYVCMFVCSFVTGE